MKSILISTQCVADLPPELVEKYNIGIIYYTIKTDKGEFRDTDEITAANVMEYMLGGKNKALSIIPSSEDYISFFREQLEKYDEIIHISISGSVSGAYENACIACKKLGLDSKRIHLIDSRHLSSGLGLLVLEAAKLNSEQGKSAMEIVDKVESLIPKVSTSFLTYNADYLYYNEKVPKKVMEICQNFNLHPVLTMADGKLSLKGMYIGSYKNAAKKYIRSITRKSRNIRNDVGFITYAGCSNTGLAAVWEDVQKKIQFDKLYMQQASASISCNCGPNTFGLLYIKR